VAEPAGGVDPPTASSAEPASPLASQTPALSSGEDASVLTLSSDEEEDGDAAMVVVAPARRLPVEAGRQAKPLWRSVRYAHGEELILDSDDD
jgi:hypothetical protein